VFIFFYFFKSTIYYAVLDRSLQQTIHTRVQPMGIYVQDWWRYCHPDVTLLSGDEPRLRKARAREQQRTLGAQAPPQTSPGPQCEPPPTHAIHTQERSQLKPDAHVTRNLAPPVKGGYVPTGCPRQLPEGGVDSPLGPTPKGGVLPQAQTRRKEDNWRQRHSARWGSYALHNPLIQDPRQAGSARSHRRLRSIAQT
jgi:hypothetical protein